MADNWFSGVMAGAGRGARQLGEGLYNAFVPERENANPTGMTPELLARMQSGEQVTLPPRPSAGETILGMTPWGPASDAWKESNQADQGGYAGGESAGNALFTLATMGVPGAKGLRGKGSVIRAHHGSPQTNLSSLTPSERGPLGPAVYWTPDERLAARYAGESGQIYSRDVPEVFSGLGSRFMDTKTNPYEVWRADSKSLLDATPPDLKAPVQSLLDKMQPNDGYPFFASLAQLTGSQEAAQALLKKAGFRGISGWVDGPEVAHFNALTSGAPIRGYHGSPNDFPAFDINRAGSTTDPGSLGRAIYASTDPKVAESRAHKYELSISPQNPLDVSLTEWGGKEAAIRNALGLPSTATAQEVTAAARAKGYDATILDYSPVGYHHKEIAAYDPSIIEILRKYGLVPAAAGAVAGAAALPQQDERAM